jgi:DNA-directed RNA polymerase subunit RPC12/RpoP
VATHKVVSAISATARADRDQVNGYCPRCNLRRLAERPSVTNRLHAVHLVLSVLTLGFWLLAYAGHLVYRQTARYRCSVCGTAVAPEVGTVGPGYYTDPVAGGKRYWNGTGWTSKTRPAWWPEAQESSRR